MVYLIETDFRLSLNVGGCPIEIRAYLTNKSGSIEGRVGAKGGCLFVYFDNFLSVVGNQGIDPNYLRGFLIKSKTVEVVTDGEIYLPCSANFTPYEGKWKIEVSLEGPVSSNFTLFTVGFRVFDSTDFL
jgi:hypothetical protein